MAGARLTSTANPIPGAVVPSRILVADDTEDIRDFLAAGLESAGFDVSTARDGAEVLTRLASPPPALVLLDLQMPVIDGLEVLRRLREAEAWAEVPVVILTASGLSDDMVEARRLGARGYLNKPIRLPKLVETVRRVLDEPDLLWLDDITEARRG